MIILYHGCIFVIGAVRILKDHLLTRCIYITHIWINGASPSHSSNRPRLGQMCGDLFRKWNKRRNLAAALKRVWYIDLDHPPGMSSPETSTESSTTHVGHDHDTDEEKDEPAVVDSPGEVSDAEADDVIGDGKARPEHASGEEGEDASGSSDGSDEESEEDEDEEDSEEEDDDDEEPALKYERLGGPVNELLKKDSGSALAIANRLMVRPININPHPYLIYCRRWVRTAGSCTSWTSKATASSRTNPTRPPSPTYAWTSPPTLSQRPPWTVRSPPPPALTPTL